MKLAYKLYTAFSAVFILLVGGFIAYLLHSSAQQLPLRQYYSPAYTAAVWDWTNPLVHNENELRETALVLSQHRINTVYVDITYYTEIARISDNSARSVRHRQFEEALSRYIRVMNARDIRVLAAAGHTDWSKPAERRHPFAIQQFVHGYNNNHENKLVGLQFDVESYNQEGFPEASMTEKSLVLMEFLDMADILAERHEQYLDDTESRNFELGFAIPYWFDNSNQNIQSVSWRDKTGPVLFHLMDRLNELPKSNVVVMAYRNAAYGNDGMLFHSRTEIEYAQSMAPRVSVIIGLEVNDVEPEKITFYGKTYTELANEVVALYEEFGAANAFDGTAINDLDGYMAMQYNEGLIRTP